MTEIKMDRNMLSFTAYISEFSEENEDISNLHEVSVVNEKNYFNKVSDMKDQPWGAMPKSVSTKSRDDKIEYINKVYDEYLPKLKKLEKTLASKLKSSASKIGNAKVITNIKAKDDLAMKVVDRNKKLEGITDFLRSTIVVPTSEDLDKVTDGVFRKFDKVYEYNPKERGAGGYGYYGARHLLVDLDGFIVEVQLKPRKLATYQKAAHKLYKATRAKQDTMDPAELKKAQAKSRRIFDRGNK